MTRPPDPLFDQRIADWLEDDPHDAPGQVLEIVLAALPSIPRRRAARAPVEVLDDEQARPLRRGRGHRRACGRWRALPDQAQTSPRSAVRARRPG